MEYVRAERQTDQSGYSRGFLVSAVEYKEQLPRLAADLPGGAGVFAKDPDHYDFYGVRCVKDLTLDRISYEATGAHDAAADRYRICPATAPCCSTRSCHTSSAAATSSRSPLDPSL